MKPFIATLIFAVLIFSACKKAKTTDAFMNTATITGPNLTMLACGAAFIIKIHGISDSGAQFNAMPSGSSVNLSTASFPINVKINWHHNTGNSCDTLVNIITLDAAQVVD